MSTLSSPEIIPKVWGHEEVIVNNSLYCGKLLHLKEGAISSLHSHDIKHETFYILSGRVALKLESVTFILGPGSSVTVEPKTKHSFMGLEASVIVEFSTPHSEEDVTRYEPSRERV